MHPERQNDHYYRRSMILLYMRMYTTYRQTLEERFLNLNMAYIQLLIHDICYDGM